MEFRPSQAIRNADLRKLEGKVFTFRADHSNEAKTQTFFRPTRETEDQMTELLGFQIYTDGWMHEYAEKDTEIGVKLKSAWLVPHANGGRDPHKRAKTYWEFFDDKQRARCVSRLTGGFETLLFDRGGDPDRCDVLLEFEGGDVLDSMNWEIESPGEWYSETFGKNQAFLFQDGFYETAADAVEYFATQSKDDLFGTRYFPVLVFPRDTAQDKIEEVIWRPKSTSPPIETADHIIYGTRCKPAEYAETIEMTYQAGGKVARNREWDWQ